MQTLAFLAVVALCPEMPETKARELSKIVAYMAKSSRQRPTLAAALMARESSCNELVINSTTGARGLYQILPSTAAYFLLGYRGQYFKLPDEVLLNPHINASVGAKVLRRALKLCKGNLAEALSVYNGQGVCQKSEFSREVLDLELKVRPSAS